VLRTDDRLLALDGLRAVAILLVVVAHTIAHWVPGGLGVTLFFFISGFIITRGLLGEKLDRSSIGRFYVRRIFRLAPALLVFIAVAALTMAAIGFPIPLSDIKASLLYYANYHSFAVIDGKVRSPLGITWSLAVEEHFYLLFPLLMFALAGKIKRLESVLAGVLVAVLVWRLVLVGAVPDERIYQGTDTRIDSLAYGCLLSVLFVRAKAEGHAQRLLALLSSTQALWAGLLLLLFTIGYRDPQFRESFRYSLQGLAFVPLFCSLFWAKKEGPLRWLLELRPMVYIGAVSYSLYLYHFLGASVCIAVVDDANPIGRAVLALSIGIVGTLLSYYVVERPVRRIGYRLTQGASTRTAPVEMEPPGEEESGATRVRFVDQGRSST
jgi:peptidoglycan/LPS O-acetylase OafA/YrhL